MIVKNRIKKYSEFQKVIAAENSKKTCFFISYRLDNTLGYTRFGISVPKKIGNAVVRNRIKRQVRAAIGLSTNFEKSVDFVIIVRRTYQIDKFEQMKSEIQQILEK